MKQILASIFIFCTLSLCKAQSSEKIIPYLLGIEAENTIYQFLKSSDKKDSIAFYMESLPDDKYKIYFLRLGIKNPNANISNRKLFINDRFYPLILDTDYWFYVKMENNFPIVGKFENEDEKKSNYIKIPPIEQRLKDKALILRDGKYPNYELTVNWTVDKKGNLVGSNKVR